jgi:tetratricopeptide (TPR) repeat protein
LGFSSLFYINNNKIATLWMNEERIGMSLDRFLNQFTALIVSFVVSGAALAQQGDELRRGMSLAQSGQWSAAAALFEQAEKKSPNDDRPQHWLGRAYEALGKNEAALDHYRRAIMLTPKSAPSHLGIGRIQRAKGNSQGAMIAFSKAIQVDPNLAEGYSSLGQLELELNQISKAKKSFSRALSLDPKDPGARIGLAVIEIRDGKEKSGVAKLESLKTEFPNQLKVRESLGKAYLNLGRSDEALEEFQAATKLAPDVPENWLGLAQCEAQKKKYHEAETAYRQALKLELSKEDEFKARVGLGQSLTAQNQNDAAYDEFQKASKIRAINVEARREEAKYLFKSGRYVEAERCAEQALAADPADVPSNVVLGKSLLAQKLPDSAIARMQAALRVQPRSPEIRMVLAQSLEQKGNDRFALEHYEAVADSSSEMSLEGAQGAGRIQLKQKNFSDAEHSFALAAKLKPGDPAILTGLAEAELGRGKPELAVGNLQKATGADPKFHPAHAMLGRAYAAQRNYKSSKAAYSTAIELDPKNVVYWKSLAAVSQADSDAGKEIEARSALARLEPSEKDHFRRLGQLYRAQGKAEEAKKAYRSVLQLSSNDMEANRALGEITFTERNYADATKYFAAVVQQKNDDAPALHMLGMSEYRLGQSEAAIGHLDRAVQIDRKNSEGAFVLGTLLEKKGTSAPLAIDAYELAFSVDPKNVEAGYRAARLRIQMGQGDRAIALLEKVTQSDPKRADAWLELGRLYKAKKDFKSGEVAFENLHKLQAPSPETSIHLGDCYAAQEKWADASQMYAKATQLNPNKPALYFTLAQAQVKNKNAEGARASLRTLTQAVPRHLEGHLLLGDLYFDIPAYTNALQSYEQALLLSPKNVHAHERSARIHLTRKEDAKALKSFQLAVASDPQRADLHWEAGKLLLTLGTLDQALSSLEKATVLKPDNAQYSYDYAVTLRKGGQHEKAVSAYERSAAVDPKRKETYAGMGQSLMKLQKYDAAAVAFGKATALDPNLFEAHYGRAEALNQTKNYAGAADSYARASGLKPTDATLKFQWGLALEQSGNLVASVPVYKEAVRLGPNDAASRSHLGAMLWKTGQKDAAAPELERAVQLNPQNGESFLMLGEYYWTKKDLPRSEKNYSAAAKLIPKDKTAHLRLGMIARQGKRYPEAEKELKESIAIQFEQVEAHYELGLTYAALKEKNDAIREFNQTIRLDKKNAWAWYQKSRILTDADEEGLRIEALRQAIAIDPNFIEPRVDLAGIYAGKEDFRSASLQYDEILERNPNHPLAVFGLADFHMKKKEPYKAVDILSQFVSRNPKDAQGQYKFAEALYITKQVDRAAMADEKALAFDPSLAGAQVLYGKILLSRKDLAGAEYRFNQARKSDENSDEAYHGLALVEQSRGNTDGAIAQALQAVKINPKNSEAHKLLGDLYTKKGMQREANEHFGKTIGVDPLADVGTRVDLDNTYTKEGLREEAEADLETRLKKNPSDSTALVGLGKMSYQNGDFERAADLLSKAVKASPQNSEAYYFLGQAYAKKENDREAVRALQMYLKLAPGSSNKTAVQAQIDQLKK